LPIYDIDQFLADPRVQARGIVVEAPDPEAGAVLMHNDADAQCRAASVGDAGPVAPRRAASRSGCR